MADKTEEYLAMMLEGYETNLTNVTQYIDQTESQLNGAKSQRDEIVSSIAELKTLLGLDEESEKPELELVED